MNKYKKWQYQIIAKDMAGVLKKKGFDAHYTEDIQEARRKVLELIPEGAVIGLGGSVTLSEMGLIDTFKEGNYNLIDRYNQPGWDATVEAYRQGLFSDYFVCGTNAITRNGELVNVDCSGNRVAAMIFGPRRVIIVAGANKVVDDLDAAMKRLKQIAPLNCRRLNHKTPCYETGKCEDCQVHARMCNYTAIIHNGMKFEGRISVILVAEETGF